MERRGDGFCVVKAERLNFCNTTGGGGDDEAVRMGDGRDDSDKGRDEDGGDDDDDGDGARDGKNEVNVADGGG